jgi:hypothetical protein
MVYWNRFISYIFRYHNYEKCENAGFAKIQKIANQGKMYISIKDIQNRKDGIYSVYLYMETLGDSPEQNIMVPIPIYVGRMYGKGGRGECEFTFDWQNVMKSGRPVTACCGIILKRNDSIEKGLPYDDMFCSSWTDNQVDYSQTFSRSNRNENEAGNQADNEFNDNIELIEHDVTTNEQETLEDDHTINEETTTAKLHISTPTELLAAVMNNSRIDQLFESRERLPLLPALEEEDGKSDVIECVKITPNDIGLLDMDNWRLGVNSFLTHGFYNYHYLMLGQIGMNQGSRRYCHILGVPGEYSSKEQYLARVFGFDRFLPATETRIKTGSFGYWIVDVKED